MPIPSRRLPSAILVLLLVLVLAGVAPLTRGTPARAAAAGPVPRTTVSIQFDDGNGQSAVGALLAKHGLHATFFINTGYVGSGDGYFTWAQLHQLSAAGNEIAGHTLTHRDLATLSKDEATREICTDRSALLSHGFAAVNFAYPFGSYTAQTEKIVQHCGYSSGRAAWGLWGSGCEDDPANCPYAVEPAHVGDLWAIPVAEAPIDLTTVDDVERIVTNAEQHGGGWVQIFFHRICPDDCDEYSWPPTQLDAFLSWLAKRSGQGTVVRTEQEVLGLPLHPAVAAPAAPAPPAGPNRLRNPSFASAAAGTPTCWEQTGSSAWSRVAGGTAERVTQTGAPDAYSALAQPLDEGTCAPAVRAGERLTLSVGYRSASYPRPVVWVRSAAGGWSFWLSGPPMTPTSGWRTTRWALPAIPKGVTAVSVGVALTGEGSVSVDHLDLRTS